MIGQSFKAPSGFTEVMQPNHHPTKPVMVGEIQANGQFRIVHQSKTVLQPEPWSKYLEEDKGKVSDAIHVDAGRFSAFEADQHPVCVIDLQCNLAPARQ